jgi:hypothetical protein
MNDACCSSCDLDGPQVATCETPTARVSHVCCECRETIHPGERYEYVRGLWDGYWSTVKTCMTCVRIREDYCGDCYEYGGLAEALWECLEVRLT